MEVLIGQTILYICLEISVSRTVRDVKTIFRNPLTFPVQRKYVILCLLDRASS